LLLKAPADAWNVAVEEPSATLTACGTFRALAPADEIASEVEPARAPDVRVAVQVAVLFAFSEFGAHCKDETFTTTSVIWAVALELLREAVKVAVTWPEKVPAVAVNVAVVAPAATVTLAGVDS
jgi:hypothetical protein